MKATVFPTSERYMAPINGVDVPCRIWRGVTEGGVEIEAYVLSIVPVNEDESPRLRAELPSFMRPTREKMQVDVERDTRSQNIHQFGMESRSQFDAGDKA